ncbi:MAG TPA: transporter substrate-binding domain-containing protein [Burkholderiaceae bacterium]
MRCVLFMLGLLAFLPQRVSAAGAAETCKHLVVSGNPEYPPYLWRDPDDDTRLIGANADLMQIAAKELGVTIDVKYMGPWARVQEETKLGHVDMIAGAFFTLPRLEYMDYMYPPFRETRTVIWTRKDARMTFNKWKDLVGQQGVTVIDNSFGEDFDRFAKKSLKITLVPSLKQALEMLDLGRVQYLIYEEDPGLAYAARMNVQNVKTMPTSVTNENLYLTISHKSPCNTGEIRGQLSQLMYKLAKQNVMKELVEANIQRWRKSAK